ncbi:tRNA threonylcarbamoyladenosine dehydratase [Tepidibacillus decaturensis]|uniref:THIF-type NAD/FAD binding fold domain-containing protein n=1 Tax=Tepidibacillus decaturensis TaxID=1413211 RepID=A0A135L2J2_9BACI|nr:tRNA threonylcarbamoyladenosine dehydratase [Tepidibacillus decaturensis]KXG43119.1 hypothetical protein U473_03085 [Tepidibacillus decaturensis]
MLHAFSRLELAIGSENLQILKNSTVVVLGVGGVGSYAAEALARSAIGKIILVDKDVVDITNINRQIHALTSTVGMSKVELMVTRIKEINPDCEVIPLHMFYNEETSEEIFSHQPDYIVDAIDTMTCKIQVILESKKRNVPIISSMGAANKMDPTQFVVTDISKTHTDPVARVIRQQLKKHGIHKGVQVVFSPEKPIALQEDLYQVVGKKTSEIRKEKRPPASNAFVPPVAGMILASVVVRELIQS